MPQVHMPREEDTYMCSHFIHLFAFSHQELLFICSVTEAENVVAIGKSDRAWPAGPPGHPIRTDPRGEGWKEKQGCLKRGSEVLTSAKGSGESSVQRMFQLRPEVAVGLEKGRKRELWASLQ